MFLLNLKYQIHRDIYRDEDPHMSVIFVQINLIIVDGGDEQSQLNQCCNGCSNYICYDCYENYKCSTCDNDFCDNCEFDYTSTCSQCNNNICKECKILLL